MPSVVNQSSSGCWPPPCDALLLLPCEKLVTSETSDLRALFFVNQDCKALDMPATMTLLHSMISSAALCC
eukprot:3720054-Karenia_brevis.AAC.1